MDWLLNLFPQKLESWVECSTGTNLAIRFDKIIQLFINPYDDLSLMVDFADQRIRQSELAVNRYCEVGDLMREIPRCVCAVGTRWLA